jgi:hypothetical protein
MKIIERGKIYIPNTQIENLFRSNINNNIYKSHSKTELPEIIKSMYTNIYKFETYRLLFLLDKIL